MTIKLGHKGKTYKLNDQVTATIIDESYNKLLQRAEVMVLFEHITSGTPSRNEVREFIAKLYGVDPQLVIVKQILGEYGRGASKAHIHIYESIDRLKLLEPKHILRRHGIQM